MQGFAKHDNSSPGGGRNKREPQELHKRSKPLSKAEERTWALADSKYTQIPAQSGGSKGHRQAPQKAQVIFLSWAQVWTF